MATPAEMRDFAAECRRWATHAQTPGNRALMMRIADQWSDTASAIERRLADGGERARADLRNKLD